MSTKTYTYEQMHRAEDEILATYNAECDKARAQCEAAIDSIKASDADEALKQGRIDVAIRQMVIREENADHARLVALRGLPWRRP